jgi:ribosomal protein L11 methyltransferase
MKSYKEFIIRTEPFLPEIITGILWELNIAGLVEEDNLIRVSAVKTEVNKKMVRDQLIKLMNVNLISNFSVEENEIENKNWNEEWEKSLKIIKVTDKMVIKTSMQKYEKKDDEIVIVIDPKMSFGTGEHQTTRLMLQFIEQYINDGMNILDAGSGTAVLAIACIKSGAKYALAIDNDELCLDNGLENIKLNNVEDSLDIRIAEIKDINETNFDLILANIQKNVLTDIAGEIAKRIIPNGLVILSGLLTDDEDETDKIYSSFGFKKIDKKQMDEWIALVFKKIN